MAPSLVLKASTNAQIVQLMTENHSINIKKNKLMPLPRDGGNTKQLSYGFVSACTSVFWAAFGLGLGFVRAMATIVQACVPTELLQFF